ncbi:unnamed protein product [Lepeophtheirus salmonis]|nr:unnamed protein product [Lepeophtheirus salmonis]
MGENQDRSDWYQGPYALINNAVHFISNEPSFNQNHPDHVAIICQVPLLELNKDEKPHTVPKELLVDNNEIETILDPGPKTIAKTKDISQSHQGFCNIAFKERDVNAASRFLKRIQFLSRNSELLLE